MKYPESNKSVPAHYARAYAYHLGGYPDKALAETEALLAIDPDDPFFLELKGQVLLESGKPKEALAPLREAVAKSGDSPLISAMLGHALVATEDKANFAEAKAVLKRAVNRDNNNPFAWFQLGIIYDREGDPARASLASAERYSLEGEPMMAMTKARIALSGIGAGLARLPARAGYRIGLEGRARARAPRQIARRYRIARRQGGDQDSRHPARVPRQLSTVPQSIRRRPARSPAGSSARC